MAVRRRSGGCLNQRALWEKLGLGNLLSEVRFWGLGITWL